jgi:hypothetical protein
VNTADGKPGVPDTLPHGIPSDHFLGAVPASAAAAAALAASSASR